MSPRHPRSITNHRTDTRKRRAAKRRLKMDIKSPGLFATRVTVPMIPARGVDRCRLIHRMMAGQSQPDCWVQRSGSRSVEASNTAEEVFITVGEVGIQVQ